LVALRAWHAAVGPHGSSAAAAALAERVAGTGLGAEPIPGGQGLFVAGMTLIVAGRAAAAARLFTESHEHAARVGAASAAGGALGMRALARLHLGLVAEAEADADAALRIGTEIGALAVLGNPPLACAIYAGIERDSPEAEALAARHDELTTPGVMSFGLVRHALGQAHAAHGRHREALDALLDCHADEPWWGRDTPSLLPWRSSAALSLAALGQGEEGRRLAREELELASRFGAPRAIGIALRAVGLTAQRQERLEALQAAAAVLQGSEASLEQARVLADLGAELRRRGERVAAREPLRAALDLASRAGATRLAARAREELKAAGARPRREHAGGVDALTAAERRVADGAARGLSNRDVAQALWLSEKTVETHMTSILRKLDLRSRHELRDALA
jgi:DNA-binding NarL/FixJ family response regulator